MNWISVKDKLPADTQEILTYYYHAPFDTHEIEIMTYFKRGTLMDTIVTRGHDDWRKNLLDTLFNKENEVKAPEDGFYMYENLTDEISSYRKHADIITHWMPLPKPPKGVE